MDPALDALANVANRGFSADITLHFPAGTIVGTLCSEADWFDAQAAYLDGLAAGDQMTAQVADSLRQTAQQRRDWWGQPTAADNEANFVQMTNAQLENGRDIGLWRGSVAHVDFWHLGR